MNLDKLKNIAQIFTGEKGVKTIVNVGVNDLDLNKVADILTEEIKDVIAEFKEHRKQLSWKFWTAEQKAIYQPITKEVIEVVEVVSKYLKITSQQKKELAEIMIWKIIEPMLPKWSVVIGSYFIKKMISTIVETVLNLIKAKVEKSIAFDPEHFAAGSVR